MNENKEITIEQLLRITAQQLNGIAVPIAQMDTIGLPIRQAINNLNICLNAFEKAEQQKAQQETSDEIQIEEVGTISEDDIPQ